MPITWITAWIGTLALIGFPFMSGFYSKDAIIEAVHASSRFGSDVAYWAVLLGVLITSFYSFRLLYLTFHGQPRYRVDVGAGDHPPDGVLQHDPHESPLVVTVPLILLAIPSDRDRLHDHRAGTVWRLVVRLDHDTAAKRYRGSRWRALPWSGRPWRRTHCRQRLSG